jgi:nucleoside-diphosphate-sugar epimerase
MSSELQIVFGTGPVGLAVIDELIARGKRVRVVTRKGQANVPAGVEVIRGDATDPNSTREVCKGATHIYNCTNPPDYHKWPEQFPPLQAGILAGAAANDAKLIVMENLYMYGPHQGLPMTEDLSHKGQGSRSSTRVQMTKTLFEAHQSGKVRAVSGRASDFFGPRVRQSAAGEQIFRAALEGKRAQVMVNGDAPHTYTYMPDIGKALVILGEHDEALGQAWHIPSPETVTPRQFLTMVCEETGQSPKLLVVPKWLVQMMSLFIPPLRGISENFYQFEEPFIVNHSKFERVFGDQMQPTPLRQAIHTTLTWYRQNLKGRG